MVCMCLPCKSGSVEKNVQTCRYILALMKLVDSVRILNSILQTAYHVISVSSPGPIEWHQNTNQQEDRAAIRQTTRVQRWVLRFSGAIQCPASLNATFRFIEVNPPVTAVALVSLLGFYVPARLRLNSIVPWKMVSQFHENRCLIVEGPSLAMQSF